MESNVFSVCSLSSITVCSSPGGCFSDSNETWFYSSAKINFLQRISCLVLISFNFGPIKQIILTLLLVGALSKALIPIYIKGTLWHVRSKTNK